MHREPQSQAIETTLLELVDALSRTLRTDAEIVAVVRRLIETRRVRLIGNFRGHRLEAGPDLRPAWAPPAVAGEGADTLDKCLDFIYMNC